MQVAVAEEKRMQVAVGRTLFVEETEPDPRGQASAAAIEAEVG
jgi:hypothetical protein